MAIFFFCGIGGIGMSSIALYLKNKGNRILGSDRSFDQGGNENIRRHLIQNGIELFPQDGSGVLPETDVFVVSTAVEESILDVRRAKELGLNIQKRAAVLAHILHTHTGVAVAGTSGKTTVTAMTGHILARMGRDPVMINGGISRNTYHNRPMSNLIFGAGDICVIEADESDGSIDLYTPDYAVVTNISLDHKAINDIKPLFESFLNRTKKGVVINADCPHTRTLHITQKQVLSFSVSGNPADLKATNIRRDGAMTHFSLNGQNVMIPLIGDHNVANALAAIGLCLHMGISPAESVQALADFKGTHRRLETIGITNGTTVIDDYAHNPEKIRAAVTALKTNTAHLFVVYQPHGFAPLRLMKDTLIDMLKEILDNTVTWIMNDVYYAGGTVAKDISSADIISPLQAAGTNARYIPTRTETIAYLKTHVHPNDTVAVMGARDETLNTFAHDILAALKNKAA